MKFEYIYGKQSQEFDYRYIPKAFMKEKRFEKMSVSAKILYAVLFEKQQESTKMGWIDENNHVYILISVEALAKEMNWNAVSTVAAIEELVNIGLLEMEVAPAATEMKDRKAYLKRLV